MSKLALMNNSNLRGVIKARIEEHIIRQLYKETRDLSFNRRLCLITQEVNSNRCLIIKVETTEILYSLEVGI